MKTRLITLILLLNSVSLFSQSDFSKRSELGIPQLREQIINGTPDHIIKEVSERDLFSFADGSSLFTIGQINEDVSRSLFKSHEEYLNKILQKIMPEEIKSDTLIRVYLKTDGSYNAFMTPSGVTFINTGLFAHATNEATIAGILAHELAHYVKRHSLETYLKWQKGEFADGMLYNNKSDNKFSIENELESDQLAMQWVLEAGYDLNGVKEGFIIMENNSKRIIDRLKHTWELKETTHPLSSKRLQNIIDFIAIHKDQKGSQYLVDEIHFSQIRNACKPLILSNLLNNFAYNECIELAFKFHLEEPQNQLFSLILMDAIRRKCYLDSDQWVNKFITSRYYDTINEENGERTKVKRTDNIFDSYPTRILNLSEEKIKTLSGGFYWRNESIFTTYEEAFNYFFSVLKKFKNKEALLINALSYSSSPEHMNQYLSEYLSQDEIRYREFATTLMNGEIHSNLQQKKLVVFSNFSSIVRQGKEDITIRPNLSSLPRQLDSLYSESIVELENRKMIILEDIKEVNPNDFELFKELQTFSYTRFISKDKTFLHILDPRYYQIFLDYNVDEIEFVNSIFLEANKRQRDKESYEAAIKNDHTSMLHKSKSTRYYEIFVTSVRLKEKGVMKVRYYGDDNTLNFKEKGTDQVRKIITRSFKSKDTLAKDLDYKFSRMEN